MSGKISPLALEQWASSAVYRPLSCQSFQGLTDAKIQK